MSDRIMVTSSFDEAEPVWRRLERDGNCYAFQTYDWCCNWFNLVGAPRGLTLCIVVLENDAGPVLLLPLAVESRTLHTALVFLGDELADYHAPLLARDFAHSDTARDFEATWRRVCAALPTYDVVAFERLPERVGSQPNPFMTLATLSVRPHAARAYCATLSDSLDDFLRRRRKSRSLQTDRRKARKLEAVGRVEFVVAETPAQIGPLLEAMIEQKSRSYAELGVANPFAVPGCIDFITRMTFEHSDAVRLFALTLDDEPIATLWGALHAGRYYHLFPTYALGAHTAHSPGNALLNRVFGWCIDHDIREYDFTVGDEEYKQHWCEQQLQLFDADLAATLRGRPFALFSLARAHIKRLIKDTPALYSGAKRVRRLLRGAT